MRARRATALLIIATLGVAAFSALSLGGVLTTSGTGARDLPIALTNLDHGASLHGNYVNFGSRVVASVTQNPALRGVVSWSVAKSRGEVIRALDDDKVYAGLVIPYDYSAHLASLSNPKASSTSPATLELLSSPAAGPSASTASSSVLQAATAAVQNAVVRQELQSLSRAHVTLRPQTAESVLNPIRINQTVAEPAPDHTGRAGAPLYIALMVIITSILGTVLLTQGIDAASRKMAALGGSPLSQLQLSRRKASLVLMFTVLAAPVQTWIVVSALGVPASSWLTFMLFTLLSLLTISTITLFWSTLAGPRGILVTILFIIVLGVPSSGATVPVQMLPDAYQWLHGWVPLRFVVDGYRAVILFHGRADAGLRTATIALFIIMLLCAAFVGGISAAKDRRTAAPMPQSMEKSLEYAGTQ